MDRCSKCQKEMEMEDGTEYKGIEFHLTWEATNKEHAEFFKKGLGKYAPKEGAEVRYGFCFECWLDSLYGVGGKDGDS